MLVVRVLVAVAARRKYVVSQGTAVTTVVFARRSSATELMDSPSIGFDEFHQCLRQLTIVNGCVLAYRPTLRWLKAMLRDAPADKTISILDVGSGGGDMLRKIRQLTRQRGINAELTGVDLNPWAKQSAEFDTPPEMNIRYETSDILLSIRCGEPTTS